MWSSLLVRTLLPRNVGLLRNGCTAMAYSRLSHPRQAQVTCTRHVTSEANAAFRMPSFMSAVLSCFETYILGDWKECHDKRDLKGWKLSYAKSFFENSGIYDLGLMQHDVADDETNYIIAEAVNRLRDDKKAKSVYDGRTYRQMRAALLDVKGFHILPPEQRMTFENDEPYLTPYIKEVLAEEKEKKEWSREMN